MIIRKIPDIVVISDEKRMEYDPIIIMVALNGNNESIHRKKPREKAHVINEVSDGRLSLHLFFKREVIVMKLYIKLKHKATIAYHYCL